MDIRVTLDWLTENYNEYNNLIFGGKLPKVGDVHNGRRFSLGLKNGRRAMGIVTYDCWNVKLKLNEDYISDERNFINTLVHEMIHLYIYWNDLRDTSSHGVIFKQKMTEINNAYGLQMSTTFKAAATFSKAKQPQAKEKFVVCFARYKGFAYVIRPAKGCLGAIDDALMRNNIPCDYVLTDSSDFDTWPLARKRLYGKQTTFQNSNILFDKTIAKGGRVLEAGEIINYR